MSFLGRKIFSFILSGFCIFAAELAFDDFLGLDDGIIGQGRAVGAHISYFSVFI